MNNQSILLPSIPRVVSEDANKAIFEIENLYPGYGHTLGNSLRRIIHSSIPGCAVTSLKIEGVQHEFSTVDGMVEDVITLILQLKRVNFKMIGDEAQVVTLNVKGEKKVFAKDITCPGQIEVINGDEYVCELSHKNANLSIEMTIEKGIGYMSKTSRMKNEKSPVGTITLDADFTPIRRVKYEVEDMRVGDRTDYNKLVLFIETDGTVTPREAFVHSVETMIAQLNVLTTIGEKKVKTPFVAPKVEVKEEEVEEVGDEVRKTKVDDLELSSRTLNALLMAGIKTVAGIVRKTEEDMLAVEGLGQKAIEEIKESIQKLGLNFKE
jgi:DNA-directed RNA polymerase subunit alpha